MTDLLALAARVEAATGADRELDGAVADLLGWRKHPNPTSAGGLIDMWIAPTGELRSWNLPAYTASLDAAMTLVPEGWCTVTAAGQSDDGTWYAELRYPYRTSYTKVALSRLKRATPALALTAACLRARAQGAEA